METQEGQAYNLIMKKENALAILDGSKKIEMRSFSEYYINMFCDKEKLQDFYKQIERCNKEKNYKPTLTLSDCLKNDGVEVLHFSNYSKTWYLDVEIKEKLVDVFDEYSKKYLNEEFCFHDWDSEKTIEELGEDEEAIQFFGFALGKVISTNLK